MQHFESQRLLIANLVDLSLYQNIMEIIMNELTLHHCVERFRAVMYELFATWK